MEAARDLFRKHGFRGVGVDAIAEAAGTNKMTLYRHFGSKDDLIAAYATTDAEGKYKFANVAPGDYYLFAQYSGTDSTICCVRCPAPRAT